MKKKQRWIAAVLAPVLLLTAGCGRPAESTKATEPTPAVTEPEKAVSAEESLDSLRQTMVGTPQLFAVAYFGYQEADNPNVSVDPIAVLKETLG